MSGSGFTRTRSTTVETLRLQVEEYRHQGTGARHLHMKAEDHQNAFLVAFLTVPSDSTGVAHILEHTALCGSEKYPVRDPFFMMLRRSLSTFMNALTAGDWTAYPFATLSRKDYFNLLSVYLDAAFFPRLDPLDFSQEGHRVEFASKGDVTSPLVYKGVVFNEMKGALSSPARLLWEKLHHNLFPTITYHHNSGGDPVNIPDLTWEDLKSFHARHYHPSNAIFMTYGDIPAEEIQEKIESQVLSRFSALPVDFSVPDEERFAMPRTVLETYPLEKEEEEAGKSHIVLSWLLGNGTDMKTLLTAYLLNGVLFDNSASPMQQALETTDLGSAPSPACGLDDSTREMVFVAGVEGSDEERAQAVEELVLGVLERVAQDGVPRAQVEAVLHQLELQRKEITGAGFPYGLKLMMTALGPAVHGGDAVAALAVDEVLDDLRRESADPEFIKRLVRAWLLDNPHRIRLVLKPDREEVNRRLQNEKSRLEEIRAAMSDEEAAQVVSQAQALEDRQNSKDDPEVLPKVTLADVPADLFIPEGVARAVGDLPVTWYDRPTNGLVYESVIVNLPQLDGPLLELLTLYASCLAEVGCGGRDYLQTQALQSAVSGGVSARVTVRNRIDDVQKTDAYFVVSSRALARNHEAMSRLLMETFVQPRFDELNRFRELISHMRAGWESRLTDSGHTLALTAASAGRGPAAALTERWRGMTGLKALKGLDESLKLPGEVERLAEHFAAIHERLLSAPRHLLAVGEGGMFDEMGQGVARVWEGMAPVASTFTPFEHPPVDEEVRRGWAASTQVHFCAKSMPVPSPDHPDGAIFSVLGGFLRNGFLHRAIREQGGAYGGGASYDSDSASFRFYSYRDPRLEGTLADFDASIDWLLTHDHSPETLEEAILGVISAIDRPSSPAGDASKAHFNALHGRLPEWRRAYRQRVLGVTMADLKRVGEQYLASKGGSVAVLSNGRTFAEHPGLGLQVELL